MVLNRQFLSPEKLLIARRGTFWPGGEEEPEAEAEAEASQSVQPKRSDKPHKEPLSIKRLPPTLG